ncbi:hypothetical protein AVEN_16260-1 [Araneus ventricosus]|uniref:Uncharacterized protein n=1 Tax=Araneus ventricosus TaxID=182803 RepID=A0A4Y2UYG0_ARAVE|nr:hypothetical protein AVEN_16260-1 [Araneus ventricosus]
MEAMDICLATTKEISYLIINHPIYSAIGAFICFMSLLKFYCRLTLGVYDGDQDLTGKTVLITGASAGESLNYAIIQMMRQNGVSVAGRP